LLSEYNFEITYIKGKVNIVEDELSWRPCIFSVIPLQTNQKRLMKYKVGKIIIIGKRQIDEV
jgi:hypothetical protein